MLKKPFSCHMRLGYNDASLLSTLAAKRQTQRCSWTPGTSGFLQYNSDIAHAHFWEVGGNEAGAPHVEARLAFVLET